MAKNTRWSPDDFRKQGRIEVDGVFVKAASQIAKGKVEKIVPGALINGLVTKIGIIDGLGKVIASGTTTNKEQLDYIKSITPSMQKQQFWQLPSGEQLIIKTMFHMDPLPAPRMVQSDKWKTDPNHPDPEKRQRAPVTRYFAYRDRLRELCAENGYNLTNVLNILFVVPMPPSWSKKKRADMKFQKHQQRPDRDNYLKAFQDAFSCDDGFVWDGRTIKVWGDSGEIIIF